MEAYHCAKDGGAVRHWDQEFARLDLPPGQYVVFANVQVAIGYLEPDPLGTAYRVLLEAGGAKNEYIGGLRYDFDDPGSRVESVALSAAISVESEASAVLKVSSTSQGRLFAWYPRLTAIQVDRVHLQCDTKTEEDFRERRLMQAALVGMSAKTGFSIDALLSGREQE